MTIMSDTEQESDYHIVSKDAVPAPALQSGSSLQKQIATIQQWLQPTDFNSPGNEYMKHLHSYVPGTGSWVRDSPTFSAWAQSAPPRHEARDKTLGCLHIRGVAGSGKSVFAASTISQLQAAEPNTPVLFFFFRQIVDKNHSAKYLVRDFASQLLSHSPLLVSKLDGLSKATGINGTELGSLWEAVVGALESMPKVYCVVDALDEMDDEDFGFIGQLLHLGTRNPDRVKVLLTSRPVPRIEEALRSPQVLHLKLEPSLIFPDVATYVDVRLMALAASLSPETENRVKQTICERAQGLFLHARLMTDSLTEGLIDGRITEETLPDSLERLPRSLKEVYEEMLKEHAQRSGVDREQQAQILMCVTHSSRPLRLIELGSLVASLRRIGNLKEGKDLVRSSCGRLLEILEDETVSVIHHSLTEFLRDESRRQTRDFFPVLDAQYAHGMLAVLSLQYLGGCPLLDTNADKPGTAGYDKFDDPSDSTKERDRREQVLEDMQLTHPLLKYAVENLVYHIENAGARNTSVLDALVAFLVPGKPAFGVWMYRHWKSRLCSSFGTVHLAAFARMPLYVIEHWALSSPFDTRDGDGRTPLSYAADMGHTDTTNFLLDHGADPESHDRLGLTPLHHAVSHRNGHVDVVQALLRVGVSPLIPKCKPAPYSVEHFCDTSCGETPLEFACRGGHADILAAFMPLIPRVNVNQCLHWVRGAKKVETILKTGHAAVDCFSGGKTKLFEAATDHDFETMQVLLQYGADPNKRCSGSIYGRNETITLEVDNPRGPMPIHALAGFERRRTLFSDEGTEMTEKCLQLLLDSGASIDATADGEVTEYKKDGNFTPLFYAVRKELSTGIDWGSYDETEQRLAAILLDAGANPNARSTFGNTPILVANPQRLAVFDVLVAHGADVNAKNKHGRSPLMQLLQHYNTQSNVKVFEKLMECGADVNVSDTDGNTILHQIVGGLNRFKAADIPFLQQLLRSGPDFNKKNAKGLPPLFDYPRGTARSSRAGIDDTEQLLQTLVDAGMDVNVRSDNGDTFLWRLVDKYNSAVGTAEMFIRLGADVTMLAKDGSTLLHHAVGLGRSIEWIQLLASEGVDPCLRDAQGNTLVHLAIDGFGGSVGRAVADILLNLGVSLSEKDGHGRTALHLASHQVREWDAARKGGEYWIDVVLDNPMFGVKDINIRDNYGATPLHYAAGTSEFNVVKLLRAGADPAALTLEGVSPLHVACLSRRPGIVGLLLATYKERGMLEEMVDICDTLGMQRTALHVASRSGVPESVVYLLAYGANVSSVDKNGFTPLHALAEFQLERALWNQKRTSSKGKGTRNIKLDDKTRPTRSHWVYHDEGEVRTLHLLLEAGADMNAKAGVAGVDVTPLELAVENKSKAMARELLMHGAESPDVSIAQLLNDDDGKRAETLQTLLQVGDPDKLASKVVEVLKEEDYATIKEFVRLGGNIMAMDPHRNNTILHEMVELGDTYMIEYFKDEALNAQSWMKRSDTPGTLLAKACERANPSLYIIKVLVEKVGLDVNARSNRRGYTYKMAKATPLHFMACGRHFWHVEAVAYLLAQGANIEAKNSYGQTPLLCAVSDEYPNGFWKEQTIKILLDHGADPNAVSKTGQSCLQAADDARVSTLLLQHGADIQKSPGVINWAVERRDAAMVKVLVDAGADPNYLAQAYTHDNSAECDDDDDNVEDNDDESNSESEEESKGAVVETHKTGEAPRYPLHNAARYPLHNAASPTNGDIRRQLVVETLLEHGADAFASYEDGSYVLQTVVEEHGLYEPFLAMENLDIERRGRHGRTLLLSASVGTNTSRPRMWEKPARHGFPETAYAAAIMALLERGAAASVTDDQGRTPLHCLCTITHTFDADDQKAFAALVARAPSSIHVVDVAGFKPLHRALISHQQWAVQHLLDHGADPNEADPDGNTALHYLARKLVGEKTSAAAAQIIFKGLLARGLDINARNNKGETPLFLCISTGWSGTRDPADVVRFPKYALANDVSYTDVLGLFTEAGADILTTDSEGSTLLHAAAGRRIEDPLLNSDQVRHVQGVFKELMAMGLDPRREDALMRTAIDLAVARRRQGIVNLFGENGKEK